MFALVLMAILAGAMAQRITGLGFGLLAAPALVLLLGPVEGILIINICGASSSLLILSRVWALVHWRRYAALAGPAVVGVLAGSWLVSRVPPAPLEVTIGILLIAALVFSQLLARTTFENNSPAATVSLGFASGALNACAGVGGPAMTAYAMMTRWDPRHFGATLQPFFLTTGLTSVIAKVVLSGGHLPELGPWQWVGIFVAMILGITGGDYLSRRIRPRLARTLLLAVAYTGAMVTILKGLQALIAG